MTIAPLAISVGTARQVQLMPRAIHTYHCRYCRAAFTSRRKDPIGCSFVCRGKLNAQARNCPPWQPEEIAILERMSGSHPVESIRASVARLDRKKGWPVRSIGGVKAEMGRRNLKRRCLDDNLTMAMLADCLGVATSVVHGWKTRLGLPVRLMSERRSCVCLRAFRKWAKAHEDRLYGLEFDRLLWVLDDAAWARRLSEQKAKRPGVQVRLRRSDTGAVFQSLNQAARSAYISPSALGKHVQQGRDRFVAGAIEWTVLSGGAS